jgi:hypothetical protein
MTVISATGENWERVEWEYMNDDGPCRSQEINPETQAMAAWGLLSLGSETALCTLPTNVYGWGYGCSSYSHTYYHTCYSIDSAGPAGVTVYQPDEACEGFNPNGYQQQVMTAYNLLNNQQKSVLSGACDPNQTNFDPDTTFTLPVDATPDPTNPGHYTDPADGALPSNGQTGTGFWNVGGWQLRGGTGTCGSSSTYSRFVECYGNIYQDGNSVYTGTLDPSVCGTPVPSSYYQGEEGGCYGWTLGAFSNWSTTCGNAVRTAQYSCTDGNGNVVADAKCLSGVTDGGAYSSSKPMPQTDNATIMTGCNYSLDYGIPDISACFNGVRTVSYPNARCVAKNESGNIVSVEPDFSKCGGAPSPKTMSCDYDPIPENSPDYARCAYDVRKTNTPYIEGGRSEFIGSDMIANDPSLDDWYTPGYISGVKQTVCTQGFSIGNECCMVSAGRTDNGMGVFLSVEVISYPAKNVTNTQSCMQIKTAQNDYIASVTGQPSYQTYQTCNILGYK